MSLFKGIVNLLTGNGQKVIGTKDNDQITVDGDVNIAKLKAGDDTLNVSGNADFISAGSGNDTINVDGNAGHVNLCKGYDDLNVGV